MSGNRDVMWMEATIASDMKILSKKLDEVYGLNVAERCANDPKTEASLRAQQEKLLLEVAELSSHLHRNYRQYNDMLKLGRAPMPTEPHETARVGGTRKGGLIGNPATRVTLTVDCRESDGIPGISNAFKTYSSNVFVCAEEWSRPEYENPEISLYKVTFAVLKGETDKRVVTGWCAVPKRNKVAVDFLTASAKYKFNIATYIVSVDTLSGDSGVSLDMLLPC